MISDDFRILRFPADVVGCRAEKGAEPVLSMVDLQQLRVEEAGEHGMFRHKSVICLKISEPWLFPFSFSGASEGSTLQ